MVNTSSQVYIEQQLRDQELIRKVDDETAQAIVRVFNRYNQRKGGMKTFQKYGPDFYRAISKKGEAKKQQYWQEYRRKKALERQKKYTFLQEGHDTSEN